MVSSKQIFLSVIIPCYNVDGYLPKCIESCAKQNSSIPTEFIFINDGSTDHTQDLLEKFASQDERVVIINKKNEGVSTARNDALNIAKGEYIYLVDGDDYLSDDAVDIIYQHLHNREIDMLITNLNRVVDGHLYPYTHGLKAGVYTPTSLLLSCEVFPTPPQNIYKAAVIRENNICFNKLLKTGEVFDFTARFMMYAQEIIVIEDSLYRYVMRPDSAVHKANYTSDLTILQTIKNLSDTCSAFMQISSFYITLFRLATSFTYNKYIKEGLIDIETINTIKHLLTDDIFKKVLGKVAWNKHSSYRDRILALYIYFTGAIGFKLLAKVQKCRK